MAQGHHLLPDVRVAPLRAASASTKSPHGPIPRGARSRASTAHHIRVRPTAARHHRHTRWDAMHLRAHPHNARRGPGTLRRLQAPTRQTQSPPRGRPDGRTPPRPRHATAGQPAGQPASQPTGPTTRTAAGRAPHTGTSNGSDGGIELQNAPSEPFGLAQMRIVAEQTPVVDRGSRDTLPDPIGVAVAARQAVDLQIRIRRCRYDQ